MTEPMTAGEALFDVEIGDPQGINFFDLRPEGVRAWEGRAARILTDAAAIRARMGDDGWRTIAELPAGQRAIVGRWNGTGAARRYWYDMKAHWYEVTAPDGSSQREWSFKEPKCPSPFYDDNGEYAEPTHFILIPPPPAPPVSEGGGV